MNVINFIPVLYYKSNSGLIMHIDLIKRQETFIGIDNNFGRYKLNYICFILLSIKAEHGRYTKPFLK